MPSREEVRAIARLARLTFTPSELDRMRRDLRGILDQIEAIRQVTARADDAPPASPAEPRPDDSRSRRTPLRPDDSHSRRTPMRPDVPGADPVALPPSAFAPEWHDGFFTVPRVRAADSGE